MKAAALIVAKCYKLPERIQENPKRGLEYLRTLFSRPGLPGSLLAAQAAEGLEDTDEVRQIVRSTNGAGAEETRRLRSGLDMDATAG